MIPFKGRSSLKQYIPNKPIKRGIKVWVRADAVNGYVCQFEVYVGKKGVREVNLGERVVKDLTKVLRGNYYRIITSQGLSFSTIYIKILYTLVEHYD